MKRPRLITKTLVKVERYNSNDKTNTTTNQTSDALSSQNTNKSCKVHSFGVPKVEVLEKTTKGTKVRTYSKCLNCTHIHYSTPYWQ